jgi:hypothetical protein
MQTYIWIYRKHQEKKEKKPTSEKKKQKKQKKKPRTHDLKIEKSQKL